MEAFEHDRRFTEDFHYQYDLRPGGRFSLEGLNGPVEILGWDQAKVEINGTKYATSQDALKDLKIEVTNTPDSVSVRAVRPSTIPRRGGTGAKFRVHVPRQTVIERIISSNGPLRVEGVTSGGRFKTSNGPVRLRGVSGDVHVDTSNGPLELAEFRGGAELNTSNGPVSIAFAEGGLQRPVRVHTSNGPVTLRTAGLAGAELRASTSNGPVSSEFPLTKVHHESRHRLEGLIGSGGPLIDIATSNGPVRITRR
jgi:DUF4097 and DUF4098 domain-containing protein YvlB